MCASGAFNMLEILKRNQNELNVLMELCYKDRNTFYRSGV